MQWGVHSNLQQRWEGIEEKYEGKKNKKQANPSTKVHTAFKQNESWQLRGGNSDESIKLRGKSVQLSQAQASGYYQDIWIMLSEETSV